MAAAPRDDEEVVGGGGGRRSEKKQRERVRCQTKNNTVIPRPNAWYYKKKKRDVWL